MDSAQLVQFYLEEINKLRKSPKSIQPMLNDRLSRITKEQDKQKLINCYSHYEFGNVMFKTVEGQKTIKDAITFINQQPKTKTLILNERLCEIAYQLGLQMQKSKQYIDLTIYKQILKKLLQSYMFGIKQKVQILVDYGFRKDLDLMTNVVIDDGNYQRTRRKMLFNELWKSVGISVHEHHQFDFFIIVLFSTHDEPVESCSCQIL